MIFRRVKAHVAKEDWFAVFIDFCIVVFGVFMGLQVQQWNEARTDKRDELVTLQAVHDEVERAVHLSFRTHKYRVDYAQGTNSAVNVLFGQQADRPLTDFECTALANSHILYVSLANLPTLTALQASRRIDIINDRQLRNSLAALIQQREALEHSLRLEQFQFNLPHLYPNSFSVGSVSEENEFRTDLERTTTASCDLNSIRMNKRLMIDIANNADGYDAFMRDGFNPWFAQFNTTHQLLDTFLKINHEEKAAP